MKRKLKWMAVVLVVLVLGFGLALFMWPRDRITAESYKKIRIWMTLEEVENILGGPGVDWKESHDLRKKFDWLSPTINDGLFDGAKEIRIWRGRRGIIEIYFDQGGNVKGKMFSVGPLVLQRYISWRQLT